MWFAITVQIGCQVVKHAQTVLKLSFTQIGYHKYMIKNHKFMIFIGLPMHHIHNSSGPLLVYALSGLGKSTLAQNHPQLVYDYDTHIYDAVQASFPNHEPRSALRKWRSLCRNHPWNEQSEAWKQWANTRKAIFYPLANLMMNSKYRLVLTSLLHPPWNIHQYYGIQCGSYMKHLSLSGRQVDNKQNEGMNLRLEGYVPLQRLPAGTYLMDQPEIQKILL